MTLRNLRKSPLFLELVERNPEIFGIQKGDRTFGNLRKFRKFCKFRKFRKFRNRSLGLHESRDDKLVLVMRTPQRASRVWELQCFLHPSEFAMVLVEVLKIIYG